MIKPRDLTLGLIGWRGRIAGSTCMLRARVSENLSFRKPFREEMLSQSFRVLPQTQEKPVFGVGFAELLRCVLIIDLA